MRKEKLSKKSEEFFNSIFKSEKQQVQSNIFCDEINKLTNKLHGLIRNNQFDENVEITKEIFQLREIIRQKTNILTKTIV